MIKTNILNVSLSGANVPVRVEWCNSTPIEIHELSFLTKDDNGHELVHNADFLLTDEIVDSLVKLLREEG